VQLFAWRATNEGGLGRQVTNVTVERHLLDAMDTLESVLGPDSNWGTDGVRNPS
jgi:hypothetical protein